MAWEAIQYVTSGLTLVAFLATVSAAVYSRRLRRDEQLIRSAPADKQADLVLATLEFFRIDASKLTKQQQYDLAIRQIGERSRRFLLSSLLIGFITIVGGCLAAYAIAKGGEARRMREGVKELTDILDYRAKRVVKSLESQKADVRKQLEARRTDLRKFPESAGNARRDAELEIMKFENALKEIDELQSDFVTLHRKNVESLSNHNYTLSHEINGNIIRRLKKYDEGYMADGDPDVIKRFFEYQELMQKVGHRIGDEYYDKLPPDTVGVLPDVSLVGSYFNDNWLNGR